MKYRAKSLLALTMTAVFTAVPAMQAAASPEFAYSAEKWAQLRDNVMEYDELADLVHEYNKTVYKNRVTYEDNRDNDFGDAKNDLWDQATDMMDQADSLYPPDTYQMAPEGAYASMLYGSAMLEYQAKLMMQTAESSVTDNVMTKIRFDQQEAGLVMQAQILMNSYEQMNNSLALLEDTKGLLNEVYQSAVLRQSIGMATQADILTAQENVSNLEASIAAAEKGKNQIERNLCIILGWEVNGDPEIRNVPEPDMERLNLLNVDADTAKALENNYDVKYYTRQLENVSEDSARKTAQANIDSSKETVRSQMKTLYEEIMNKKSDYDTAQSALALEAVNKRDIDLKYQIGEASLLEFLQEQNTYLQKEMDVKTAKLNLVQAMQNYDWAVNGLVASS